MADPYRNYKFEVEASGLIRAGFSSVDGLERSIEVIEYREGGDNETMRKLPGQAGFTDIVLERGITDNQDFENLINEIYNPDGANGLQGGENYRRTFTIYLKDKSGRRVKKWVAQRCWCSNKQISKLDAAGNEVLFETLTLVHEGLREKTL